MYRGRPFELAKTAAMRCGADLSVVSAGLGWIKAETSIPAYDLTVSKAGISRHLNAPLDHRSWWAFITSGPFSDDPAQDLAGRPAVLACVSQEYATFMAEALKDFPAERLRIFGAGLDRKVPKHLRKAVLPYDERLAALSAGTRADFAQRALLHFVTVLGVTSDLERDRASVFTAMSHLPNIVQRVERVHLSDEAIRTLILGMLPQVGARSSIMLRYLRDVHRVACEQRRFRRLFDEVIASRR